MTEYLDIVDENDNVIGGDTRENVHKGYHIHRGIHVFVVNSKGEILVQKRSRHKEDRPDHYDASVGAQVQSGESYEESAVREAEEELGFTPKKLVEICNYKSYSPRQRENRRLFVCFYGGSFKFDKKEVESIKFISTDKIKGMIKKEEKFTDGFLISLRHYLHYSKKNQDSS